MGPPPKTKNATESAAGVSRDVLDLPPRSRKQSVLGVTSPRLGIEVKHPVALVFLLQDKQDCRMNRIQILL